MKTYVWRRLDEPGMEVAHVETIDHATGVQIGRTYEVRWALDGPALDLDLNGANPLHVELEEHDYFDVFASPFFNTLPVLGDGLLTAGPARDYMMRFVQVPELTVVPSKQRYQPLGDRVVRFSSGSFTADISFDQDGIVTLYEGFLERISD